MTAVESTNDSGVAMVVHTAGFVVPATDGSVEVMTPMERIEFEQELQRIVHFPRELGWLMIYVGVLGIILPGVIGFPARDRRGGRGVAGRTEVAVPLGEPQSRAFGARQPEADQPNGRRY